MKPDLKEELWLATTKIHVTKEQRNYLYELRKQGHQFVRNAWREEITRQLAEQIGKFNSGFWANIARKQVSKSKKSIARRAK